MFVIDTLINGIVGIADKYLKNSGDKEKFINELRQNEVELQKMVMGFEHEENKERFTLIGKLIERGCIPAIFYTFLFIEINNRIIAPYIEFFLDKKIPIVSSSEDFYSLITTLILALFTKKGFDGFSPNKKSGGSIEKK